MNLDATKVFAYIVAALILVGVYYALVIYPYVLDPEVKLWLTGIAGGAATFIFGDQAASRAARATTAAINTGLSATPNDQMPTVTVDSGPPATATVSAAPAPPEEGQG